MATKTSSSCRLTWAFPYPKMKLPAHCVACGESPERDQLVAAHETGSCCRMAEDRSETHDANAA